MRREVAGAIQEKGHRWHMARDKVVSPEGSRWHPAGSGDGVKRREVVGTTQEKEHEGHVAGSSGEGMWVALGWD